MSHDGAPRGDSSASGSRKSRPRSQLNAGAGLSAEALLAASAQASDQLARMLARHDRSRSRSRTRSPKAAPHRSMAALSISGESVNGQQQQHAHPADDDPFLVHTAGSGGASSISSTILGAQRSSHKAAASRHRSDSQQRRRERERQRERERERERERARDHDRSDAVSVSSSTTAASEAARPHRSRSSKHRSHRSGISKSRSRSRSASRPRNHNGLMQLAQEHQRAASSHAEERDRRHRHSSSTLHAHSRSRHSRSRSPAHYKSSSSIGGSNNGHRRTHSRTRTRSRSHSRNRYPAGLAPPLQAVGGGPDHELRSKFIEPFEGSVSGGGQGLGGYASPAMSPDRLEARLAFEQARRDREDAELRLLMGEREREREREREYALRAHMGETGSSPRYYAARYERGFPNRGPFDEEEESRFELDGDEHDADDAVRREPKLSGTQAGGGGVLVCVLCECRFEEPASGTVLAGSGSKVPRYLLCGHTACTSCLSRLVAAQEELRLASDTGVAAPGAQLASSLSLPCPVGPNCGPTPVRAEEGALGLPVNRSYLDVSKFLRSRRAAGLGLRDTGVGRGDERGEEEKVAELNAELTADAQAQTALQLGYNLGTSLPCQQCQVHLASLFCQACNVRFCASCSASVHVGRALSEHVKRGLVLPLNVARARGLLFASAGGAGGAAGGGAVTSPALMCPTHSDQSLSLYCRTCQVPVCRDCVTPLFHGKHLPPAHDVDLLATVLQSTATELKGGLHALESVVARIEHSIARAGAQVEQVGSRIADVRAELKDSFALVRAAVLRSLAEREAKLEAELVSKARQKEERIQTHRAALAKLLVGARAAQEEAVRVLGGASHDAGTTGGPGDAPDIFSIKALLDVRAAIAAGSSAVVSAGAPGQPALLDAAGLAQQDVLLRVKPRDLIRTLEAEISRQGGVIASLPSPPSFVSFAAAGTAMVLSWAPATLPVEGEVLEYVLDVCELPRAWRAQLRLVNPALFPEAPQPAEDSEAEEKWGGAGPLPPVARAAVNWLSVAPGTVQVGGPELVWKLPGGGADWAGPFTTLYSGEVTSVKHDNLNVLSAYIYRLTVKNDLGASVPTYSMPCTLPCMHLSYSSDMDSNGLVTYLGSAGGSAPWANPASSGLIEVSASSVQVGEASSLTSRAASTLQTLNRHLSWVRLDLGRGQPFRLQLSHYTLAHCGRGVGVRRALRNWALQGSLNGIDWVTLREHVNDTSLAAVPLATATWAVTQPAPQAYRYVRILQTDVNHANDHHLALGQIELYGWLVRD